MPAGDLIEANLGDLTGDYCYQAELNAHLIGDGQPWVITRIDGIGDVEVPANTAPRSLATGHASGIHMTAPGGIVFTAKTVDTTTPAEMEEAIADLRAAWAIDTPSYEPMELHLLAPFHGHLYVVGWPNTVKVTRDYAGGGNATAVCAFLKTEPAETLVVPTS